MLLGCESKPTFTTIVNNPIFSDSQKKTVNWNTPISLINYNMVKLFADFHYIPHLENGKIITQIKGDNDTWKDSNSYTYTNGTPTEIYKDFRKYVNKYDGEHLIESMQYAYTYTDGKVSASRNIFTQDTYTFTYPSERCVERYNDPTKAGWQTRSKECTDSEGRVLNFEEYIIRDSSNTSKTINEYTYTNGNVSSHIYQTFTNDKMTRNVITTYEYENGLLTKTIKESKILKKFSKQLFNYEVVQNDPLILRTYKQKGNKPFEKSKTIFFDSTGRVVEMEDHIGDFNRRYRVE